jgi:hypothetical protein
VHPIVALYVADNNVLNVLFSKSLSKVKFALLQDSKAWRGSRGIALLFLDLGARKAWVVSTTPRPLYPGKDPVPIV